MFPLTDGYDYAVMLGVAALCGAFGGFVFELLQRRDGNPGKIELPKRYKGMTPLYDLGWLASVIVGAVAAVAILYFFPPVLNIEANGQAATATLQYDLIKLVALSLITGSAGGSVLSALQARVLAKLNEQKAQSTRAVSETQLLQFGQVAKAETEAAVRSALEEAQTRFEGVLQEAIAETPPQLNAQLSRSAVIPEAVKGYLEAHPPTGPEEKSRKIETMLASAAEEASKSLAERMEERVDDARAVLSSVAPAPADAQTGVSSPTPASIGVAS